MADITITHNEAVSLFNHLDFYILREIQDEGGRYDNLGYLLNLIHIYERCKAEAKMEIENGE